MPASSSLSTLIKDALTRHGGLFPLLKKLVGIFLREGFAGFRRRKREHASRLQGGFVLQPVKAQKVDEKVEPRRDLKPGLTLVGHPYAVLGRAEDIRTAAMACGAAQLPFELINLHGRYDRDKAAMHKDFPYYSRVSESGNHQVNVFYLNADEMKSAERNLGDAIFTGRYNIGCYAWELSRFPDAWVPSFNKLDEIWAPTRFIQQAIAEKTELPVVNMPFAIAPGDEGLQSRADLGLAPNKFLFLFFFDFRSYVQRKNPWAVLEAFAQAFPQASDEVQLVIKVNGTEEKAVDYREFLTHPLVQSDRVQVLDQTLDDRGIKSLVANCDCFVSLHRCEGFGRGLAEAMYYGKPVIATAYSGNLDFMNPLNSCLVDQALIPVPTGAYPFGDGQLWADPDIEQAAWYMKRLLADGAYAEQIGKQAQAYIRAFHSYDYVGRQMLRRLKRLAKI